MPTEKLTGVKIRSLKPEQGKTRINYFDASYTGLALRVGARDKSWVYFHRVNGKLRRPVLGKYADREAHHMSRQPAVDAATHDQARRQTEGGNVLANEICS